VGRRSTRGRRTLGRSRREFDETISRGTPDSSRRRRSEGVLIRRAQGVSQTILVAGGGGERQARQEQGAKERDLIKGLKGHGRLAVA